MRLATLGAASALGIALSTAAASADYREGLFGFEIADYESARSAWTECAESGDYRCQYALGILHKEGYGGPVRRDEAVRWLRMAADQGSTDAALELGVLHAIGGDGIEQDAVTAYAWFLLAARGGDPVAEQRRDLTRSMLLDEEIAEGERR
jgi:TPR repeat protein